MRRPSGDQVGSRSWGSVVRRVRLAPSASTRYSPFDRNARRGSAAWGVELAALGVGGAVGVTIGVTGDIWVVGDSVLGAGAAVTTAEAEVGDTIAADARVAAVTVGGRIAGTPLDDWVGTPQPPIANSATSASVPRRHGLDRMIERR